METHDLLHVPDDKVRRARKQSGDPAFVLSPQPLVPKELQGESALGLSGDYENLGELPRSYGYPIFFGIARDPHTLFVYWEIDWKEVFGDNPPVDHKVHLRVMANDGNEESRVAVEPLAGNQYIPVSQARSIYRIELGFYEPADVWNSVAFSDAIATPPDDVSETTEIDVATVPFHLSFQRMVDVFRGSRYDGDALVEILARLQKRADDPTDDTLTESDRELLRTLERGLSGTVAKQRSRLRKSENAFASREQIEAILGFGASSRM